MQEQFAGFAVDDSVNDSDDDSDRSDSEDEYFEIPHDKSFKLNDYFAGSKQIRIPLRCNSAQRFQYKAAAVRDKKIGGTVTVTWRWFPFLDVEKVMSTIASLGGCCTFIQHGS